MSTKHAVIIAIGIIAASLILAVAPLLAKPDSAIGLQRQQSGRFQIVMGSGKADEPFGDMFVLDSDSGRVWARVKENAGLYWKASDEIPEGTKKTNAKP